MSRWFGFGTMVKMVRDKKDTPRDKLEDVRPVNSTAGRHSMLLLKMYEEIAEIAKKPNDIYEYADLYNLMLELAILHDIAPEDINTAAYQKQEEFGGFKKGLIFTRNCDTPIAKELENNVSNKT